jgi:hypothetical protein
MVKIVTDYLLIAWLRLLDRMESSLEDHGLLYLLFSN